MKPRPSPVALLARRRLQGLPDREARVFACTILSFALGCGGPSGPGVASDGGAPHDAHHASDVAMDAPREHEADAASGRDTGVEGDARPDAPSDSGAPISNDAAVCPDGGCVTQLFSLPSVLGYGLAVDSKGIYIDVGNGDLSSSAAGEILLLSLNGGTVTTLVSSTSTTAPTSLAVDTTRLYWADVPVATLESSSSLGGTPSTLWSQGTGLPSLMAMDADSLYWMDTELGTIESLPRAGGSPTTIVSGQPDLTWMTIDSTNVYWTAQDSSASLTGKVLKTALKGGGAEVTLASDQPTPANIVVSGDLVYWVGGGQADTGVVTSVPIAGGSPTTLLTGRNSLSSLATDGESLYMGEVVGNLFKIPVAGGTVTTLAVSTTGWPAYLSIYGSSIYWLQQNDASGIAIFEATPR